MSAADSGLMIIAAPVAVTIGAACEVPVIPAYWLLVPVVSTLVLTTVTPGA